MGYYFRSYSQQRVLFGFKLLYLAKKLSTTVLIFFSTW